MSHSISTPYPQICSTLRLSSYFIPDICDGAGVLKIDIYAKHSSLFYLWRTSSASDKNELDVMDDSSDNPALELYESDSLMWSRCSYSDSSSFDSSLVVTLEYYNKGIFRGSNKPVQFTKIEWRRTRSRGISGLYASKFWHSIVTNIEFFISFSSLHFFDNW